ncbi:hypothetical protein HCN52_13680, partial [Streptomyces bohaiensis]|nr:hypothetical protein [Streptomyces bohaiensis]
MRRPPSRTVSSCLGAALALLATVSGCVTVDGRPPQAPPQPGVSVDVEGPDGAVGEGGAAPADPSGSSADDPDETGAGSRPHSSPAGDEEDDARSGGTPHPTGGPDADPDPDPAVPTDSAPPPAKPA